MCYNIVTIMTLDQIRQYIFTECNKEDNAQMLIPMTTMEQRISTIAGAYSAHSPTKNKQEILNLTSQVFFECKRDYLQHLYQLQNQPFSAGDDRFNQIIFSPEEYSMLRLGRKVLAGKVSQKLYNSEPFTDQVITQLFKDAQQDIAQLQIDYSLLLS